MNRVYPAVGLEVSKLAFGTASLHHLILRQDRRRLLLLAADSGITHFDTSPYYGFGLAETELGAALGATSVTIASKVGLYAPGAPGATSTGKVLARKVLGKIIPRMSRPTVDWSVDRARRSLDLTLRRLGRSQLDILFLHEPSSQLLNTEEFSRWLEREQRGGRIRFWGLAGEAKAALATIPLIRHLDPILQVRDSLDNLEADQLRLAEQPYHFTYGYLRAAHRSDWSPVETLERALRRNTSTSIVFSTKHPQRLSQLIRTAERHAQD